MTAKIIDGVAISKSIRQECKQKVQNHQDAWNITPCLTVILVGEDPASKINVRNKMKAAEDVGVISRLHEFPSTIDPDTVLKLIDELNADPAGHGILVQLPLPPQFNIHSVLHRIHPSKDVDGFHLYNVGGLVVGERVYSPCTHYGVMKLLEHENIPVAGQNVRRRLSPSVMQSPATSPSSPSSPTSSSPPQGCPD